MLTGHRCRAFNWEFVERVTKYRETDGAAVFAQVRITSSSVSSCLLVSYVLLEHCAVSAYLDSLDACRCADPVLLVWQLQVVVPGQPDQLVVIAQWRPPLKTFVLEVGITMGSTVGPSALQPAWLPDRYL
jgi:hypothetical protein